MSDTEIKKKIVEPPRDKKPDLPSVVAIFKVHAQQTYVKYLMVLLLFVMLAAIYFLVKNVMSPPPKVYIKLYDKNLRGYKHTNLDQVNRKLDKERKVFILVKVIAKADYYMDHHGERVPRDYALVRFLNVYNQELSTVFVKMEKKKKGYMEGSGKFALDKMPNENNTIQEDVFVILTNKARSADKLQVRVPIKQ